MIRLIYATAVGLLWATTALAQNQATEPMKLFYDYGTVELSGFIPADANQKFVEFLDKYPNTHTVRLWSFGGKIFGAIDIAREIYKRKLNTEVAVLSSRKHTPETACNSSCFFIFISGLKRELKDGAKLGIHAWSYDVEPDAMTKNRILIQLLNFVKDQHVSAASIYKMLGVPSNDIHYVTEEELNSWHILLDRSSPIIATTNLR